MISENVTFLHMQEKFKEIGRKMKYKQQQQ